MDDHHSATASPRRRRSDARRSEEAIIDAARTVLGESPSASMEEIATVAGVTRQTIYAHFPSRDALIAAILEIGVGEILAAMDTADLDARTPPDALSAFLDIGWKLLRRYYPLLLDSPDAHTLVVRETPQDPVSARLEQIIRRGQRTGDFDRSLPSTWLTAAILGLGHTAAEQVDSRRLTTRRAAATLRESALRLCGAADTQH
jgi:AcrR family transcriptional regulator